MCEVDNLILHYELVMFYTIARFVLQNKTIQWLLLSNI